MKVDIEESWKKVLSEYLETESFKSLANFVKQESVSETIYPKPKDIFNALNLCSFDDVKVVIIGQDPYHGVGQAHGLCFSVPDGSKAPPSLKNILKELESDLSQKPQVSDNLTSWAKQGVLLLNSVLTVREGEPASHANNGWEEFTDKIIKQISDQRKHCVFLLWGAYAQKKGLIIDRSKHLVLESAHPSPLSAYRGFFGNKQFSQTNKYLLKYKKNIINW